MKHKTKVFCPHCHHSGINYTSSHVDGRPMMICQKCQYKWSDGIRGRALRNRIRKWEVR